MKLKDKVGWQEYVKLNKDEYGACCVRYAEKWAEMMEKELEKGSKLEDIANETSHKANTEGITGFMFGCAVSMLSQCWEFGEQLRVWHNIKTQIGDEGERANKSGGVLNPALMTARIRGSNEETHDS